MQAYSYRNAPAVPAFDDTAPIAFVDGNCALCSFSARMIHRFDGSGAVRICPVQTPLGQAILTHYGYSPDDPDTWLFLKEGRVHADSDAIIALGRHIGGWAGALRALGLLPRPLRNWLYRWVAHHRYALFGQADLCALPDPAFQARLMQ